MPLGWRCASADAGFSLRGFRHSTMQLENPLMKRVARSRPTMRWSIGFTRRTQLSGQPFAAEGPAPGQRGPLHLRQFGDAGGERRADDQRLVIRKLRGQRHRNGLCTRIVEEWLRLQPLLTHSKFSSFAVVGYPDPIPLPSPKPFADTEHYRLVFPVAKHCGDSPVPI